MHNELRHDLKKSDARQLATTLTRQLVYPILAVNRGRTSCTGARAWFSTRSSPKTSSCWLIRCPSW